MHYNYKKFYSLVLMAVADANYRFLYVNLGANGSASDGRVFRDCSFGEALEQGPRPHKLKLTIRRGSAIVYPDIVVM